MKSWYRFSISELDTRFHQDVKKQQQQLALIENFIPSEKTIKLLQQPINKYGVELVQSYADDFYNKFKQHILPENLSIGLTQLMLLSAKNPKGLSNTVDAHTLYLIVDKVRDFLGKSKYNIRGPNTNLLIDSIIMMLIRKINEEYTKQEFNPHIFRVLSDVNPGTINRLMKEYIDTSGNIKQEELSSLINILSEARELQISSLALQVNEMYDDFVNDIQTSNEIQGIFVSDMFNLKIVFLDICLYNSSEFARRYTSKLLRSYDQFISVDDYESDSSSLEESNKETYRQIKSYASMFNQTFNNIMHPSYVVESGISVFWNLHRTNTKKINFILQEIPLAIQQEFKKRLKPISKEEILVKAGFDPYVLKSDDTEIVLRISPQEISTGDFSPEDVLVGADKNIYSKDKIYNLISDILVSFSAESSVSESLLNEFFSSAVDITDYPEGSDRDILSFVIINIFGQNPTMFTDFIKEKGGQEQVDSIGEIKISALKLPDSIYQFFNLYSGSKLETEVLKVFRDNFGIKASPYRIAVNSPNGCPTNPRGFETDFTVLTNVLQGLKSDGSPIVNRQVIIGGEVFGFVNENILEQMRHGDRIFNPSETVVVYSVPRERIDDAAILEEVESFYKYKISPPRILIYENYLTGEKRLARIKDEYFIKTEWKRMYEALASNISGVNFMFVANPKLPGVIPIEFQIENELNKFKVLWQKLRGNKSPSLIYVENYLKSHPDKISEYGDVVVIDKHSVKPRSYSPAQTYLLSSLAQHKIQNGFIPIYNKYNGINSKINSEYINLYNSLLNKRKEILDNINTNTDEQKKQQLGREYLRINIEIQNLYQKFPEILKMKETLQTLEDFAESDRPIEEYVNSGIDNIALHYNYILAHRKLKQLINEIFDSSEEQDIINSRDVQRKINFYSNLRKKINNIFKIKTTAELKLISA